MKNFDDMGILEMAKTLGEMGDDLKSCKHGSSVCEPCAYDRGFNVALEEAAKIADITFAHDDPDGEVSSIAKFIGREIRVLKDRP